MTKPKIIIGLFSLLIISCGEEKSNKEKTSAKKQEVIMTDKNENSENIKISDFIEKQTKIIELSETISLPKESISDFGTYNEEHSLDKQAKQDFLICVRNGSSRNANYILEGNGRMLYIRFIDANWSGVRNTCGNFRPSNRRFTFPDSRMYQYQMTLFEEAPGARNYFINTCQENVTYSIRTKRGFKYYVYTNDTSGDHEDNDGYISYCYGLN